MEAVAQLAWSKGADAAVVHTSFSAVTIVVCSEKNLVISGLAYGDCIILEALRRVKIEHKNKLAALKGEDFIIPVKHSEICVKLVKEVVL